ncbi:uncharacterized protein MELLADRAFT_106889 [Melampsora larici-populina 98AG31]|uniref:Secreted protein n=1 Tax=Melampsora larici-populina (strain 98AG31 / pathotype 3-4-7) TaxID=747676 RepID=F4RMZ4_MELLP|nr:uncharacterized protein MELLADRAFT_106889 [Melampsora larici-populina 98AG31]EGG06205.1 secreted protein [Melampsora larici-populina 98AG31]
MKLFAYSLQLALAISPTFPTLAMDTFLKQRGKPKIAEPSQLQTGMVEKTRFDHHTTTGPIPPQQDEIPYKSEVPPAPETKQNLKSFVTPGSLAAKHGVRTWDLATSSEMYNFVQKAQKHIWRPPPPTDNSFTAELSSWIDTVEEAVGILGREEISFVDRFRNLGLLTEMLRVVPLQPHGKEILMKGWPDRLKLELKATQVYLQIDAGYAEPIAKYLLRYAYNKHEEEVMGWSDVNECFGRAALIGAYQKRVMDEAPGQSAKNIDQIISRYLMEASLPQEKEEIENLIVEMRLNLRGVSFDTWEGKYSIDILSHLFKHASAVKTRLLELEKQKEFLKDTNSPYAKVILKALSTEQNVSPLLKQNIGKMMKLKSQPSDEFLESMVKHMHSSIESGDRNSAILMYKLLQIETHYNPGVEEKIYKLLFDGNHVPDYLVQLWAHIHPQLTVEKKIYFQNNQMKFDHYKHFESGHYVMMIGKNSKYFLDAKRHILALEMSKVECEPFTRLCESLNSLTVKPHQDIQKDSIERICKEVQDCIESIEDDVPKRYAMLIETLLRVLEYEPQSIGHLLEYIDQNESFRNGLYQCLNHIIKLGHLNEKAAPQMLGFVTQMIKAYSKIWPEGFPIGRMNVFFGLEDENPADKAKRISKATDDLKTVITASRFF